MAWWDPPAEKRMPTVSGIKGAQIETELAAFVNLLINRNVRSYLEIGGKYGDTFYRVMASLPHESRGVLVDLPPNERRATLLRENFRHLNYKGAKVQLILGNSHEQSIVDRVTDLGPFDACFIDGDRTYAGILDDWMTYGPMCNLTAFHDIRAAGSHLAESTKGKAVSGEPDMMAPKLWADIKAAGFEVMEFVDPAEYVGIGVVFNHREARI